MSFLGLRHDPDFRRGARDMLGLSLGMAAWGLVTGVAMVKSGLSVPLAVLMSLVVYAGSAQLTSLPLIASGAPVWVVWFAACCVNLRFVIFSSQWRPYFAGLTRPQRLRAAFFAADANLVLFTRRYPQPRPEPGQMPYFWGGVVTVWLSWQVPSLVGIFQATQLPAGWDIAFAGTLALLGLVCSMLSDRSSWMAAGVASAAAVAAYALPLRLNLVVAIAAAVALGLVAARPQASAPEGPP